MSMIVGMFAVVAPIFVATGIGYAWAKRGVGYDTQFVSRIILTVGAPCLVFRAVAEMPVSLAAFSEMAVAYVLALAILAVVGLVALRLMGRLPAHSYLPSVMFGNTGAVGLPACYFAFGEPGLALGVAPIVIDAVAQVTVGGAVAAGSTGFKKVLRIPVLYGLVAALPFLLTGTPLPDWLDNTVTMFSDIVIPLMLLSMGISLAQLSVSTFGRTSVLAAVRVLGGFAVGYGLAVAFGFEGVARGVLILQTAMPVAVFNYMFAQMYERKPEEVAGMIVISTILVFALLPLFILLVT